MRIAKSSQFEKDYISLPKIIQKKVVRQLKFLAVNLRHPSIRAKKIAGSDNV